MKKQRTAFICSSFSRVHLIGTFFLLMANLVANSQVITVTVNTIQKFNHSASISTIDAIESNMIEYPEYIVGENIYTFDLNNKKVSLKNCDGFFTFEIVKINESDNVLDCVAFDGVGDVLFLVGETSDGNMQFLMGLIDDDKYRGGFSMNEDFSYVVK